MSLDGEDQEDELLALASIYEECFTTSRNHTHEDGGAEGTSGELGGVLAIHLDLPPDFTLLARLTTAAGEVKEERYPVEHLPPINLHFTFPPTYPSQDPPSFTLSCKWLNRAQLTRLCQKLDAIWEENKGSVITFMWAQFIKEEAMEHLELTDTLDLDTVRPTRTSRPCDVTAEAKQSGAGPGNSYSGSARKDVPDLCEGGDRVDRRCDIEPIGALAACDVGRGMGKCDGSVNFEKERCLEEGEETIGMQRKDFDAGKGEELYDGTLILGEEESGREEKLETLDWEREKISVEKDAENQCDKTENTAYETCDNSNKSEEGAEARANTCVIRAIQDIGPKTNLLNLLRDYDEEMRLKVFKGKVFECKVCFLEKVGANCLEFWPCRHVYCKTCMASFFSVQISEGNIKSLKCPEEKCESEANPKQVQEVVPADLYNRWDQMLLNSTLSSLGDIQPCPRIHCQYPVTIEEGQGQCPSCKFVFCGICRYSWHGVEPCRLKDSEVRKTIDLFINGTDKEKIMLEAQYGKKYLSSLRDEYLSLTYLEENSKGCPKCRSQIEKIDGCNKMTCNRCSVYFCWLCRKVLNPGNPYNHFSDRNSPCLNQLFQGVEDLEDDWYDDNDMYEDDDDDDDDF